MRGNTSAPERRRQVLGALREAALLLAAALVVACQGSLPSPGETRTKTKASVPADVVLRGGPVYTMNAVRSWARAIAIRDGILIYVGTEQGVALLIGEITRVVELRGHTVLPSFQDAHIHPI